MKNNKLKITQDKYSDLSLQKLIDIARLPENDDESVDMAAIVLELIKRLKDLESRVDDAETNIRHLEPKEYYE